MILGAPRLILGCKFPDRHFPDSIFPIQTKVLKVRIFDDLLFRKIAGSEHRIFAEMNSL